MSEWDETPVGFVGIENDQLINNLAWVVRGKSNAKVLVTVADLGPVRPAAVYRELDSDQSSLVTAFYRLRDRDLIEYAHRDDEGNPQYIVTQLGQAVLDVLTKWEGAA